MPVPWISTITTRSSSCLPTHAVLDLGMRLEGKNAIRESMKMRVRQHSLAPRLDQHFHRGAGFEERTRRVVSHVVSTRGYTKRAGGTDPLYVADCGRALRRYLRDDAGRLALQDADTARCIPRSCDRQAVTLHARRRFHFCGRYCRAFEGMAIMRGMAETLAIELGLARISRSAADCADVARLHRARPELALADGADSRPDPGQRVGRAVRANAAACGNATQRRRHPIATATCSVSAS